MNRRSFLPLLMATAGLILATVAILGLIQNRSLWNFPAASIDSVQTTGSGESVPPDLQASKPAPDFELTSLNGSAVRLSDYQGHPVLVNYWATWCPPCRDELPLIQKRYERFSPDLVVLAINAGEDPETVKNYIEENGFTFPVLLDPDWKAEALFGIMAYPTSVFIDGKGNILVRYVGGMSAHTLDDYLRIIGVSE
jgi:peroxiredoxin